MQGTAPSPLKPGGLQRWKRIGLGALKSYFADPDNSARCAATAFFGFLSLFPALATIALIYGIVADRVLAETVDSLDYLVPDAARTILIEQLNMLSAQPPITLGLGLLVSVPLLLWSGSRGVDALLFAMSRAHGTKGRRGLVKSVLYAVGLTIGGSIFVVVALLAVAGLPALLPTGEGALLLTLRWPVLLALCILMLAALYRWGPDLHPHRFSHIWPGAILASILWVLASALFSIYAENWGNYEASFGSVSAAVILLLWLYNSAQIFVIGAALNAEIERDGAQ